jgi:hypothetical protein
MVPPAMAAAGVFGFANGNWDMNPETRTRKQIRTTPIVAINAPTISRHNPAAIGLTPRLVVEAQLEERMVRPTNVRSRALLCE